MYPRAPSLEKAFGIKKWFYNSSIPLLLEQYDDPLICPPQAPDNNERKMEGKINMR